jgi:phosphate-selective porin
MSVRPRKIGLPRWGALTTSRNPGWTKRFACAIAILLALPTQADPVPSHRSSNQSAQILVQQTEAAPSPPEPPSSDAPSTKPSEPAATEPEPATATTSDKEPGYPRFSARGQIQFQVDDGSLGAPSANNPFPSSNGIGPFPADSRLFVRRFRPAFEMAMSPSFDLQTEFNIDPQTERIQILDVRFNYDLAEHTYLSAGRYKVPFGWEGLRSSRATNTIERSDMTVALYPERDVGLSVTHQSQRLGLFSFGTFLGQPRSNGGVNNSYDLIGRALFRINDDLKIGVSGHSGTFRPSNGEIDIPVRRLGTEVQYNSGNLKLEGEAMWSDGYNTMSRTDTRAFGYYAAAIYRVADPLDLVLQYDRFDPDLDAVNNRTPSNSVNARDRKVIGLNYYLDRDLMHRFMLNYEFKQDLEGPKLQTDGFRVRYQFAW